MDAFTAGLRTWFGAWAPPLRWIEAPKLDATDKRPIEPGWQFEPDMLALLARHCTSARLVLAKAIDTPPALVVHMALGESPPSETDIQRGSVYVAAVENPSLPASVMRRLLDETKKPPLGFMIGLARNPSAPADVLERVLTLPRAPAARLEIAKHPHATPQMLSQLAKDGLKETRLAARAPQVPRRRLSLESEEVLPQTATSLLGGAATSPDHASPLMEHDTAAGSGCPRMDTPPAPSPSPAGRSVPGHSTTGRSAPGRSTAERSATRRSPPGRSVRVRCCGTAAGIEHPSTDTAPE